jgi:large subunit ribosomal protein L5
MLEYYYKNVIRQDLLTKFSYKNLHELPELKQIVLTFPLSQSSLKALLPTLSALFLISSQKPFLLVSKRPSIVLKTKTGIPIGCKVDLRGDSIFFFLEKLIFSVLPRVKNLKWGYSQKNVFLRLENVFLFREIEKEFDHFQDVSKLNIHILFKAKSYHEVLAFLGALKFPSSH